MKRYSFLFLVAIFFASSVYAQEPNMSVYGAKKGGISPKVSKFFKNLRYSDELVLGVGLDSRSSFAVGDLIAAYHRFGDTVTLGVGTGLLASRMLDERHYYYLTDEVSNHYSFTLYLPLFMRVKVSPWRFGAWQPFGRLDFGGLVRLGEGAGGGLFFAPTLGTHYQATAKLNLFFAMSTHWMQTSYLFDEHLGQPAATVGSSAMTLMLHAGLDF